MAAVRSPLDEQLARLASGRHHDPFQILGSHREGREEVVRVFMPDVDSVTIEGPELPMKRRGESALFEWRGAPGRVPERYSLRWRDASGEASAHDAYAFGPQISDFDLHLFGEGSHRHAQRFLGAHPREVDGVAGVLFATWAPNAERISVVGDFNRWDGRRHPMRSRGGSGVWELFVPGVAPGDLYKLELRTRGGGAVVLKIDPYARRFQKRPQTAAVVEADSAFPWADAGWLARRREAAWQRTPMSVYEVHLGSWQREADGAFLDYETLAERLVDHVSSLGFTHVELLPVTEHPLDASWGYQTTGFFAPTSRFGSPDGLRTLIDRCHARGIGVILDWVPGHFPRDAHGLARFDGTAVYEHADPRRGEHRDWGTLIFNYGRNEVRSFLISSALYWIESFHLDGLRVDAVASMLYLDYSREPGDWVPNEYGGNENLDAIRFLRELNHVVQSTHPGVTVTAEESTAWPQVTRPPEVGGLGFAMKWNMGWMHDTLGYMSHDPVHRKHHHDRLTFGLLYAHTENYVLPFSHDEVVHGKGSLLAKMPGDDWQRFANLRLLYAYMFTYPGKKLLFMGSEFAQREEWSEVGTLDWGARHDPRHAGVERLVADLNGLYREHPPLHRFDFDSGRGFEWIDCHDYAQSIICYLRRDEAGGVVIVALNFTPVPRTGYRIGVPEPGDYAELINSDAALYGGSNLGNLGTVPAVEEPWMGRPCALTLTLPPLGAVVLRRVPAA